MLDQQTKSDVSVGQHKGVKTFRWSLILTAGLSGVMIVGLFISYAITDIVSVDRWLESSKSLLAGWRLCLFLLLIGGWPWWSQLYAQWTRMDTELNLRLLNYRWRLALWLLVMEAVLSQDVLTGFINSLVS